MQLKYATIINLMLIIVVVYYSTNRCFVNRHFETLPLEDNRPVNRGSILITNKTRNLFV